MPKYCAKCNMSLFDGQFICPNCSQKSHDEQMRKVGQLKGGCFSLLSLTLFIVFSVVFMCNL